MFNLDDLPDFVLVEILCRLPREYAVQCACVSKRWYSLVYNPYFVGRFLRQQNDNQKPIPRPRLIFTNPEHRREFFTNPKCTSKFFSMSKQPPEPEKLKFSLRCLPCFQGPVKTEEGEPMVVGTYNDLVLCCATMRFQRDYYICNAYTKQWEALPSPPQCHEEVGVGFICDPYYKECKEDADQRKEETSTSKASFHVNTEYRYRVVRIIPESPGGSVQFKAEIFSSETGKWTETIVLCPRSFYLDERHEGVAYNGMLYWMSSSAGSIIGLDPYSNNNVDKKYNCRFIDRPEDDQVPVTATFDLLSVCRVGGRGERLRMCQFSGNNEDGVVDQLSVWELKDDQVDNDSNWILVRRISLNRMFSQNPVIRKWRDQGCWHDEIMLLAFDPNDDDILYVDFSGHVVMFNINGEGWITCYLNTQLNYGTIQNHRRRAVFPFVIPWWPTPVTTRQKQSFNTYCWDFQVA